MFKSTVAQFSDRINDILFNAVWNLARDLDYSENEIKLRNLLKGIGEKLMQVILADVTLQRHLKTQTLDFYNKGLP